ncbi:MAG: hypothetical protein ABIR15_13825 [Chitinophagaceae bacterium]
MSRITPHIIAIFVFLFSYSFCFSQTGVSVKASINRDKIIIGEPVELKLEARVPLDTDAKWFPVDSIAHFEFIDKGKIDTAITSDTRTYRQTIIVTSFDSGRWALPSFPLAIGNKEYLTDSLPVSVAYSNFDPKQDYHDIKDIIEVENTTLRYVNWMVLALAIVSLLGVIYFLRKKVSKTQAAVIKKPVSKLSPLQEAMQALEDLHQRGYAEQAGTKVFHTELNDILRTYLYRKTNIATMEKTSGELMLQLKQFNLPAGDFTMLAQSLRMNDAVKFAKYQPGAQENEQALETIKKSVQQLDTIIS